MEEKNINAAESIRDFDKTFYEDLLMEQQEQM